MRARQARVRRAQEPVQVRAPTFEPQEPEKSGERLAERGLREAQAAFDREWDPQRRERGFERRPHPLDARADDRDLLGPHAGTQQVENFLADELVGDARAGSLEEAQLTGERRRLGRLVDEERAFEIGEARLRPVRPAGRQLLDPAAADGGKIGRRPLEGHEGGASWLVRKRDGQLGTRCQALEQRPLGAGQILEPVRKDRAAVPGAELVGDAAGRVPPLVIAVPEAEPLELLAVGGVERGKILVRPDRRARADPDSSSPSVPASESEKPGKRAERPSPFELRAREHAPDDQSALRLGRDRARGGIGARQLLEQVREGADRTAEQGRRALQQIALDSVDVRAIRHDQNRVLVERGQIAVEKGRHLARVGRAGEKRQRHAAILVPGPDSSWTWNGVKPWKMREKSRPAADEGLRCGRPRTTAAASGRMAGHVGRAGVAQISLLRAATSICIRQTQRRALPFSDFLAAVVTDKDRLPSQSNPPI